MSEETKVCNGCGLKFPKSEFSTRSAKCKACVKEYNRKYREKYRQELNDKKKIYYESNKEYLLGYQKEYRRNNIELLRERGRRQYIKSREKVLKYQKEYRDSHKEQIAEYKKQYAIDNYEKVSEHKKKHYEENREHYREKAHQYYIENADKLKDYQKVYTKENSEKIRERAKAYNEKNKEIISKRKREYAIKNKDKINKHYLERIEKEPLFRLKVQIRNLLGVSLRSNGYTKKSSTMKIVGCEYEFLLNHLKETWKKNYGNEWNGEPYHIDHIIPLATAKTEEDVIRLFHYTNLQMLKPKDNLDKKDKLDWSIDNK